MMRDQLRARLIADEGVKLHAYQDHLGFWTIGVGRLIDQRKGGGITLSEAHLLLDHDIDRCVRDVTAALPWVDALSPTRQAVLVMMAFQMGVGGLLQFTRTLTAIKSARYDDAKRFMLASKWAQQTPARARRLAEMMRTGGWPS